MNLEARITDLSGFLPEARGQISTLGWVRFRENRLSGTLHGQGKDLVLNGIRAGSFTAELHLKDSPWEANRLLTWKAVWKICKSDRFRSRPFISKLQVS